MPKIIEITKLAVRQEDGSIIELPDGCYAHEFLSGKNYTIIGYKKEGHQGAIDEKGNIIIPIKYSEELEKLLSSYNTIIMVIDEKYVIVKNNEKYDILDLTIMRVIYSGLPDMTNVIRKLVMNLKK